MVTVFSGLLKFNSNDAIFFLVFGLN